MQGSRLDGIPTPPTQDIFDQMLEALAAWKHLEPLLHFASEPHGSLPSGHLARTVRLREDFEHRMDSVLHLIEEAQEAANSSTGEMDGTPLITLDLLHLQRMRLSRLSAEAHLVLYGLKPDLHREMLNATAEEILQTNEQLILGDSNALQPIRSLCVTQDMADVMVLFRQVEEAAREVTNGDREEAARLMHLVPEGTERMLRLTQKVDDFYRGLVDDTNCSRPRLQHHKRHRRPGGTENVPGAAADGLGLAAGAGATNAAAIPTGHGSADTFGPKQPGYTALWRSSGAAGTLHLGRAEGRPGLAWEAAQGLPLAKGLADAGLPPADHR